MRGDRLLIEPRHRKAAHCIAPIIQERLAREPRPFIVAIAGESGSGKSELASALADALAASGIHAVILQQDDYFALPPITNNRARRDDINRVGSGEVRLDSLDRDLRSIASGRRVIDKPLVFYSEDRIGREQFDVGGAQVVLVEGTYVALLKAVHLRVFINRTYQETASDRLRRAREAQDAFLERVLEIEHKAVSKEKDVADLVVTADFDVILRSTVAIERAKKDEPK